MPGMRTTVTLDADVEATLKDHMRRQGVSFKDALNNAVRAGLAQTRTPTKRFRQKTYDLGARPGIDLTKALDLAAGLEDVEILRKIELRK